VENEHREIAVVMPVRSPDPGFLREALACLEAQTLPPREVCVVDDGSPTAVVVPTTPVAVTVVRQAPAGISAARDHGIRRTTAPIVHILDHDELLAPDFYERLAPAFDDPAVGIAFAAMRLIGADGAALGGRFPDADWSAPHDWLHALVTANRIGSSAALFRRSLWDDIGGFQPYRFVQDWRFWIDAAPRCRIAYDDRLLASHRRHPAQLTDASRDAELLLEGAQMLRDLRLPMRCRPTRARMSARLRLAAADCGGSGRSSRLMLSMANLPLAPLSAIGVAIRAMR
jgi:glycosyltransferase involved in cell wall biosynthesis